jgi:hypothetical protein
MRGQSVDCPRFVFPAIALNKMQGQAILLGILSGIIKEINLETPQAAVL